MRRSLTSAGWRSRAPCQAHACLRTPSMRTQSPSRTTASASNQAR
jgi:hypothetical protein